MNKKFCKTLGLAILLASSLPFSLVSAETFEEVPTGETTISSMADDPLKEYKEKAANQVSTIKEPTREEPESEPKKETETLTTEDTLTTESSAEDTPDNEEKLKRQPRGGGGIRPFSTTLIEGMDIDADFAKLLREDKSTTNDGGPWSGFGKNKNQLTDDDMAALTEINVSFKSLTSLKGIEYAVNLTKLQSENNQLNDLNVTKNINLINLDCGWNDLSNLDLSNNLLLEILNCRDNKIKDLNITNNTRLTYLNCVWNQLSMLDITKNTVLRELQCGVNMLSVLDVTKNTMLRVLGCSSNQLSDLDLAKNTALENLMCTHNQLSTLDITTNIELRYLYCSSNQLSMLNGLKYVASSLIILDCSINQLNKLDVKSNVNLTNLNCYGNHIADISSAYNLDKLADLNVSGQTIYIPVPFVSSSGEAVVDILKTTAGQGLSVYGSIISPPPSFAYNGDKIFIPNVTRPSISDEYIYFSYDGTQLVEGAIGGTKIFDGTIYLITVSELEHTLVPNMKRVKSGENIQWTWIIESTNVKKAEDVHAKLNLPVGLVIDPSSITKNGAPATIADINGTNNLGILDYNEQITFTFETTATGNVGDWLKAEGRLDWEDDTIASPYHNEREGSAQIQDDEQTYTPKDTDDMSIQSVPVYFNHGTNPIMSTAQTYHLHSMNYQSNTKVVTDGFYTRIKDDRAISTGWKLTAKLSDFKDSSNAPMPNGTGTSLKLDNMSIERVTDRDTPQETIDPSPTGTDVPSSVQSTETIVAGQTTAKTLVTAQPNQGQDTWQLRMPFDKISLNLPANAGKKGTVYKAKLTWSLDDTP
ncbi:WxL domain-containing protein [Enterococcus avium]|uniref:WxL domain-containing protein n=2 Tax=Enterococcus avium TaxID=33945 RepID=UPI002E148C90